MSTNPKVSVAVIAYNHGPFIEQALNSVVEQDVSFDYEVLVGEDDSDDETREKCIAYAKEQEQKVRLFLRNREDVVYIYGVATGRYNVIKTLEAANGEYIALCEGDDYWISKDKLQSAVEYLDKNRQYAGVCHDSLRRTGDTLVPWRKHNAKRVFTLNDVIAPHAPFHTSSFVFRRRCIEVLPSFLWTVQSFDMALFILVASYGPIGRIPQEMSVYRYHEGGITNQKVYKHLYINYARLSMLTEIQKYLRHDDVPRYKEVKKYHVRQMARLVGNPMRMLQTIKFILFLFRRTRS